jgi:tetratricopeptide (TPR) repeat protein
MKRAVWLFLAVTSLALILAVERGRRGRFQEDFDARMRAVAEGRHADAEVHLKAATRSYKADDPRLAVYPTGLAVAYGKQAKDAEAEPLCRRVLAIREKALGRAHTDVAESLSNLACVLRDEKKYEESRRLFERAVSTFEKSLGPNYPGLAWSLSQCA